MPSRLAFSRRVQAIAGGVLTHPRRGEADRGEHRQAAGAAAEVTDSLSTHFRYDLNSGHFTGLRSVTSWANNRLTQRSNKFHHSMTSSARTKSVGGIVNPSALAVFRLMTS